ncbi:hypothetical protein Pelo_10548 [Pelomyxa schiedti]|nr:hypothetical protein Pelo_10548 [Pelomyxa schiedti]
MSAATPEEVQAALALLQSHPNLLKVTLSTCPCCGGTGKVKGYSFDLQPTHAMGLRCHPLRVLHVTNNDGYCPTTVALTPVLPQGSQVETLVNPGNLQGKTFNGYDAILCTIWQSIEKDPYGNLLAQAVDSGTTVVLCCFTNSSGYSYPAGKFQSGNYNPFTVAADASADVHLGKVHIPTHPIMTNVRAITQGSDKRRTVLARSTTGTVTLVADWDDGNPLCAIREDKPGLVVSCTFQCGSVGVGGDGLLLVGNALRLTRH